MRRIDKLRSEATRLNDAFVFLLFLSTLTTFSSNLLADSKDDHVTLKSSDNQYQLIAPSGWESYDFKLDNVAIGARNDQKIEFAEVIVESVQDYTSSLPDYAAAKRDTMAMCLDNARIAAGKGLKINDRDAMRFEIHGELPGTNVTVGYLLTVIKDKDKYIQVIAWTEDSHFSDNLSEMQSLADGFSVPDEKSK